MPEYLSPGVYVEEIDTGPKPIEGVSTSTVGMVGLTERGPVDLPILVTGPGNYARWFGGLLDRIAFGDDGLLPHAVDGFFRNGGRRLYLTRVLPDGALPAILALYDERAGLNARANVLLEAAQVGAPLVSLDNVGLNGGNVVRVGDGSRAEWREIDATGPAVATALVLATPLTRPFASGSEVRGYARTLDGTLGGPHALAEATTRGATQIVVRSAGPILTGLNLTDNLIELALGGGPSCRA